MSNVEPRGTFDKVMAYNANRTVTGTARTRYVFIEVKCIDLLDLMEQEEILIQGRSMEVSILKVMHAKQRNKVRFSFHFNFHKWT